MVKGLQHPSPGDIALIMKHYTFDDKDLILHYISFELAPDVKDINLMRNMTSPDAEHIVDGS